MMATLVADPELRDHELAALRAGSTPVPRTRPGPAQANLPGDIPVRSDDRRNVSPVVIVITVLSRVPRHAL